MSKTIIAVRHFGLGGRESLETAVTVACKWLHCLSFSSSSSGVYYLKSSESSEMYPVYCHMFSLSAKCAEGGWTLVMKLDRNQVKHVIINGIQSPIQGV